jgi:hypothetical protein
MRVEPLANGLAYGAPDAPVIPRKTFIAGSVSRRRTGPAWG